MNLLSVDPGVAGGIAWQVDDKPSGCCAMPATEGDVWQKLLELYGKGVRTAYVEKVGGFIMGAGGSRQFVFGESFGFLKGCITALGMRLILIRPQEWQKALALGQIGRLKIPKTATPEQRKSLKAMNDHAKREWKRKLKEEAQRRFPHLSATLSNADALLILEYARKVESA